MWTVFKDISCLVATSFEGMGFEVAEDGGVARFCSGKASAGGGVARFGSGTASELFTFFAL